LFDFFAGEMSSFVPHIVIHLFWLNVRMLRAINDDVKVSK